MESTLSGSDLSLARFPGALPPAILCIPCGDSGIGTAGELFRNLIQPRTCRPEGRRYNCDALRWHDLAVPHFSRALGVAVR
jgi:hypothetical protein